MPKLRRLENGEEKHLGIYGHAPGWAYVAFSLLYLRAPILHSTDHPFQEVPVSVASTDLPAL